MKKVIAGIGLCASLMIAGSAYAGQAADNTGCGLGTVLWGDKSDNSVISQSFQATTNGTSGNQTFGITSGTLGCNQPANIAANERLMEFATANLDNLAKDIAQGEGESLATLAELMEVPAANRASFNSTLQQNFDYIFVSGDVNVTQVLERIVVISG